MRRPASRSVLFAHAPSTRLRLHPPDAHSAPHRSRRGRPHCSLALLRVAVPAVLAHVSARPRVAAALPPQLRGLSGAPAAFAIAALLAQAPGPSAAPVAAAVLRQAPAGVALLLFAGARGNASGKDRPRRRGLRRAFAVGAAGSAVGAFVACACMTWSGALGVDVAVKLAAVFCATYVGGTLNYVSVGAAVGLPETFMAAGLAADLLLTGVYLVGLFWLGAAQGVGASCALARPGGAAVDSEAPPRPSTNFPPSLGRLALPVATAFAVQRVCRHVTRHRLLASVPGIQGLDVLLVSAVASLVSLSPLAPRLSSAPAVADAALLLFYAALGSATRIADMLRAGPAVLCFGAIALAVHVLFMAVGARWLLRAPVSECLVASNANVGGPTTAAAYAASLGWADLVGPAVVVGAVGYAVANPIALALRALLARLLLA
jgi:uncharacterized membrane protein